MSCPPSPRRCRLSPWRGSARSGARADRRVRNPPRWSSQDAVSTACSQPWLSLSSAWCPCTGNSSNCGRPRLPPLAEASIVRGVETALGSSVEAVGRRFSMGKKIAIVGAGAVGGYAGAHMVQAGEDVIFIDPWPAHVEAMRQHGLRVTHAKDVAEFTVPVRALHLTEVQQLMKEAPVDIAFV